MVGRRLRSGLVSSALVPPRSATTDRRAARAPPSLHPDSDMRLFVLVVAALAAAGPARAHDTWVQTNINLIRTGDAVHVDRKLGNHGHDHRDLKPPSNADLEHA